MHELAAYRQFIDYLKLVCEKEAEKERRMVKTKLEKMRPYIPTQNTLTVIERAIEDNNFGLAYTFLTNLNESVEDWLKEMNRPHF
jgi:intergrase/recombinase